MNKAGTSNTQGKSLRVDSDPNVHYIVFAPDGGWGWVVVVASFFTNFLADGVMYTFGIFVDDIKDDLHTDLATISMSNSLMTGLYYGLGPFICSLINCMGFRLVALIGSILATGCFVAASFLTNPAHFVLIYGIAGGVGFSMCYLPAILAVGFYFNKWRGIAMSIAVCGSSVGTLALSPIFIIVLKDYNWRVKYRILAAFCSVLCLCSLMYRPIKPMRVIDERTGDDDDKGSHLSLRNLDNPTFGDLARASGVEALSMASFRMLWNSASKMTVLSELDNKYKNKRRGCCGCCSTRTRTPFRPMYKDDAFLNASVASVKLNTDRSIDYTLNVTRVPTQRDLGQEGKCVCCPESMMRTLRTMLDFSLLKSPAFVLLVLSGFVSYLGIFVPYMYINQMNMREGMPEEKTAYFLVVMGVTSTCGRIFYGLITLSRHVRALIATYIGLAISGCAALVGAYHKDQATQFIYAGIYAFTIACIPAIRPSMAVDLVGLERLTSAFGIIVLFEGAACLIGLPVAAYIFEISDNYKYPIMFAGFSMLLSGVILLPIPCIVAYERRHVEQREQRIREQKAKALARANALLAAKERSQRTRKPK